jgi:hypothetical protein
MKPSALFLALLLAAAEALAHPGHGEPGWLHRHADVLTDLGMAGLVLAGAVAAAIGARKLLAR